MTNKPSSPKALTLDRLSRRQRQLMEILFACGPATAREIWQEMPDRASYASARSTLRSLVDGGLATHVREGKTYVYTAVTERGEAAESALKRLVSTFYQGSIAQAASGLLGLGENKLNREELDQLAALVEKARGNQEGPSAQTPSKKTSGSDSQTKSI